MHICPYFEEIFFGYLSKRRCSNWKDIGLLRPHIFKSWVWQMLSNEDRSVTHLPPLRCTLSPCMFLFNLHCNIVMTSLLHSVVTLFCLNGANSSVGWNIVVSCVSTVGASSSTLHYQGHVLRSCSFGFGGIWDLSLSSRAGQLWSLDYSVDWRLYRYVCTPLSPLESRF